MRTVIMTGATSFLGQNLLQKLLSKGYKVYALVRKSSPSLGNLPQGEHLQLIYGSLSELDSIKEYVDSADYFIHFGWDGSGYAGRANRDIQQTNVIYSMNALKLADELGCKKFIFSGSQAEYGIIHSSINETTVSNPVSEYGKAKLEFAQKANLFCEGRQISFIHLRIFSVYGQGDRDGTLINLCIQKFNMGEKMVMGPCRQKWNYLYIEDFSRIILLLIEKDVDTGIYIVAGAETRMLREFVEEIYGLSNKSGTFEFGEATENPEGSPELDPCIDKIKELLQIDEMTPFKEGIKNIMRLSGMEVKE